MLVSEHSRAYELLRHEFKAYCSEGEVLLVRLQHIPRQQSAVLRPLAEAGINVRNAYTVIGEAAESMVCIEPDPPAELLRARELLISHGFELMDGDGQRQG